MFEFNSDEQKQFVMNFYLYQKYDKTSEFIIDLDKIWSWLEFSQKNHAKTLLQKHFTLDIHYKVLLPAPREQTTTENNRGGHNKEIIILIQLLLLISTIFGNGLGFQKRTKQKIYLLNILKKIKTIQTRSLNSGSEFMKVKNLMEGKIKKPLC